MRIGIIAEGRGDLAVITNILKGWLDLDREHVQFLRPEYVLDETDLHEQSEEQFSNWAHVRDECRDYSRIHEFLDTPLDEDRLVVIHIDAAEAELVGYDVVRPTGTALEHAIELRKRVADKLAEWTAGRGTEQLRYAIAVEETDAWILTIYATKETSQHRDPKRKLLQELNRSNRLSDKERKRLFQLKAYERYDRLSQDFRKRSTLQKCATRNQSLRLFIESLAGDGVASG
jgi:hypothetical protein